MRERAKKEEEGCEESGRGKRTNGGGRGEGAEKACYSLTHSRLEGSAMLLANKHRLLHLFLFSTASMHLGESAAEPRCLGLVKSKVKLLISVTARGERGEIWCV